MWTGMQLKYLFQEDGGEPWWIVGGGGKGLRPGLESGCSAKEEDIISDKSVTLLYYNYKNSIHTILKVRNALLHKTVIVIDK